MTPGLWSDLNPPYGTVVADPPWHYSARPVGGAKPGTMSVHELKSSSQNVED
jgi:hypothetical protein